MIGEVLAKHLRLIGRLSDDDEAALLGIRGDIRDVPQGEDVLKEGEHPTESVVVITGLLHRYRRNPQGRRQIHSVYLPTDAPSLETLHMEVMDNSLGALAPSRIGVIPHAELFRVMDAHPRILALCWRETLVQAAIFREWLMRNSQLLAHAQLAHFFCEIMTRARAAGLASGDTCALPITLEDLGDALGMSAVHVTRTLAVLRKAGLAEFRDGTLTVLQWEPLVEIAEFDPGYLHLHR